MRDAVAKGQKEIALPLPRGWILVGLAVAAWALVGGLVFLGTSLFGFIASVI